MPWPNGARNPVWRKHTSRASHQEEGENNIWRDWTSSWRTGTMPANNDSKRKVEDGSTSFLLYHW